MCRSAVAHGLHNKAEEFENLKWSGCKKRSRCRMKILQRLSFCLCSSKRGRFVWKTRTFPAQMGTAKQALPL